MDIAKLFPVLSQEPGCAFIILCPQAAFRVIPLPKIKIDIIKYVVDIFNDPASVWWEKNPFLNNNKYDNVLYCAKVNYRQIVHIVILAMSNRWLDETM